jgi:hypothetical protein
VLSVGVDARASGERPRFGAIAVSPHFAETPPKSTPFRVPETEKVAEVPVTKENVGQEQHFALVGKNTQIDASSYCFITSEPGSWNSDEGAAVMVRSEQPVAVRAERLVESKDGASVLETVSAWVDPVTAGARLITREKIPLTRIAEGPDNARVYAMRDADGVNVIGVADAHDELDRPSGFTLDQQTVSNCHHVRLHLAVKKDVPDTAEIDFTVPVQRAAPDPADPDTPGAILRVRQLRAVSSLSWGSRDKEPVLSVRFAWNGAPRTP